MKNESKLKHLFMSLMVVGCSLGMASCSDDDDDPVKEPTVEAVIGEYSGKMYVAAPVTYASESKAEQTGGTDISATVKNDSVYFAKFPVDDIVKAIAPSELVEAIIGALGDVKYEIGYKATMNTAKDSVVMTFDPKPLELKISLSENTQEIKVDISATDKGSYSIDKKKLKFAINVDGVTINEEPLKDFKSQFSFDMNQK
ncbi:MAG: DUF4840 domain-containing protein [Tannerella sp.]|jgi:hypothetical protein|nr:DUF4840 domain-containing protein [Tannerella sp.]